MFVQTSVFDAGLGTLADKGYWVCPTTHPEVPLVSNPLSEKG